MISPPIIGKADLTVEEERDHFRQRYESMKLVMKELQQQMTIFKTRCAGVDTMTLILKDSKEQIATLARQKQALETAVANLQNRLTTHGLSSSVNLEETELFVPGASKQTLDNLAKENARLRTMIKNCDNLPSRKSSEDTEALKTSVENLERENNQLKAKLLELEGLKLSLVEQYELTSKKLKKEHQAEVELLSQRLQEGALIQRDKDVLIGQYTSVEIQTEADPRNEKLDELKKYIKVIEESVVQLDQGFDALLSSSPATPSDCYNDSTNAFPEKAYRDLEHKFNEAMMMNRRWQVHNEEQEKELNALRSRSAALEELCKDCESWKQEAEARAMEIGDLKRKMGHLLQERTQRAAQGQVDPSIVEILKQQIQVCTEDFNTERKDREQAVTRVKQLEAEVIRLRHENDTFRMQSSLPPMYSDVHRHTSPATQPSLNAERGPRPPQYPRFNSPGYPSLPAPNMIPPAPPPFTSAVSANPSSVASERLPYGNYNTGGSGMLYAPGQQGEIYRQQSSRSQSDLNSSDSGSPVLGPMSMPAPRRDSSSPRSRAGSDKGGVRSSGVVACPTCGKSFQTHHILQHMHSCKD